MRPDRRVSNAPPTVIVTQAIGVTATAVLLRATATPNVLLHTVRVTTAPAVPAMLRNLPCTTADPATAVLHLIPVTGKI